jgi:4-amino-4-deoxy-L-arabinose transferase-like glycosyltransferase
LWNTPPSPDWDEVAYGYNAYSILNTGADEYGAKLPVVLRSFDDYKPALYSYLSIPPVVLLGLNTFSVRFADALFSVFGVIACFYLVKTLLKRDDLALLSSFFLAVSPWQIQFSRFSHEAVIGVTFNILTVLFLFLGLKRPKFLIFSGVFWALSFYSYQSEKLFAPLLGVLLFILFFKEIFKINWKYLAASILAVFIILAPMGNYVLHNSKALSRAMGTSIFSHQTELLDLSAKKLIADRQTNNYFGLVVNNRRVVYAQTFVRNYLSHYDPVWLFVKGDLPRHHPPGMGVLYYFDLPFILLGIWFLIKTKLVSRKIKLLIFGWFLLAPIPAAFTFDVPHAARDLNVLPIPQIFTALGAYSVIGYLRVKLKQNLYKASIILMSILFLLNFAYYFNGYFNKLNNLYSNEWQYGYKEAISYISKVSNKYDKIIVSNQVPLDQSYMFFLFYLKYSPKSYQQEGSHRNFDKYVFKKIDWKNDSSGNSLIVGSPKDISDNTKVIKVINYLNNDPAIVIAKSDK